MISNQLVETSLLELRDIIESNGLKVIDIYDNVKREIDLNYHKIIQKDCHKALEVKLETSCIKPEDTRSVSIGQSSDESAIASYKKSYSEMISMVETHQPKTLPKLTRFMPQLERLESEFNVSDLTHNMICEIYYKSTDMKHEILAFLMNDKTLIVEDYLDNDKLCNLIICNKYFNTNIVDKYSPVTRDPNNLDITNIIRESRKSPLYSTQDNEKSKSSIRFIDIKPNEEMEILKFSLRSIYPNQLEGIIWLTLYNVVLGDYATIKSDNLECLKMYSYEKMLHLLSLDLPKLVYLEIYTADNFIPNKLFDKLINIKLIIVRHYHQQLDNMNLKLYRKNEQALRYYENGNVLPNDCQLYTYTDYLSTKV